ncbi:MAG: AI-2E family transporter [Paracoccus sp. (in: a-proteobacteria)]
MPEITPPPAALDHSPPPAPRRAIAVSTIVATLVLIALLAAAWFWSDILLLVFAAILLAIALRAGARPLHRRFGLNIKIGVLVVLLAVIGVFAGIGMLAGPAVSEQFRELLNRLPESWEVLNNWMSGTAVGDAIQSRMEDGADLGESAAEVAQRLPDLLTMLSGALNATIGGLFSVFLMLVIALYVALEGERYRAGTLDLVPLQHRARAGQILDEMGHKLGLWMGGQALDMLAVAVMAGVGLWLLGVPLAFLLALIAGLTNIVPIIGPFFSGTIAVLFSLTQGFDLAVQVAILFVVIQLIDGEIILPMIQRFAVSLPPAMTVVAIMAFSSLFGIGGVLLATPLLVVGIVLVRRIYIEDVLGDDLD